MRKTLSVGPMLAAALFLLPGAVQADEVEIEKGIFISAASLVRRDLPDDFPYQVFHEGFAVVRVQVRNASPTEVFSLDPERMTIHNPKGKTIKRVSAAELTPKMVKYYQGGGGGPGVSLTTSAGGPVFNPRQRPYGERRTTIGGGGGPGIIHVGKVKELRELLDRYEIQAVNVAPGQTIEGFFYLKSKKSGNRLIGGQVRLPGNRTVGF